MHVDHEVRAARSLRQDLGFARGPSGGVAPDCGATAAWSAASGADAVSAVVPATACLMKSRRIEKKCPAAFPSDGGLQWRKQRGSRGASQILRLFRFLGRDWFASNCTIIGRDLRQRDCCRT